MRNNIIDYLIDVGQKYWTNSSNEIRKLGIPNIDKNNGFEIKRIRLPYWASGIGIGQDNHILVYRRFINSEDYRECDWWRNAFFMLNCMQEREFEKRYGPIHSNYSKIKGFDKELFRYAWVNRIFLFLRRWAAVSQKADETRCFGELPKPIIHISHDIDYIKHEIRLRIKQGGFNIYNSLKNGYNLSIMKKGIKVLFLNYNLKKSIEKSLEIDKSNNIQSVFYVFPGSFKKLKNPIFNPSYSIKNDPYIKRLIKTILEYGNKLGIHPGYYCYKDAHSLIKYKVLMEDFLGIKLIKIRQHWLRFSFEKTWLAQEKAGFLEDSTLGFNDIPGFRNSSALRFHPYDFNKNSSLNIIEIPLILMDGHLYTYQHKDIFNIQKSISELIDEVKAVHGEASVLWHPHTLFEPFNTIDGYEFLIKNIANDKFKT